MLAFAPGPLANAATTVATADAPANPDRLVREAIEAPKHWSFVGQRSAIKWDGSGATASVTRIEHRAPDLTRRLYLAPQSLYGDYVIRKGARTFQFDVIHERVMSSVNPVIEYGPIIRNRAELMRANYRPVIGAVETVAGRPGISVTFINRYTGERTLHVWIDAQTKFVLGHEMYHADGSLASRSRFDSIRYTDHIPASVFSTAVPSGYSAVQGPRYKVPLQDLADAQRSAGFVPQSPRYLPEGFSLVGADVGVVKGVRSLHVLYSDGLRNLSLFENNRDAAADFGTLTPSSTSVQTNAAKYVKNGQTTLLTWREHGLAFALVGDLELHELRQIAASVVPG